MFSCCATILCSTFQNKFECMIRFSKLVDKFSKDWNDYDIKERVIAKVTLILKFFYFFKSIIFFSNIIKVSTVCSLVLWPYFVQLFKINFKNKISFQSWLKMEVEECSKESEINLNSEICSDFKKSILNVFLQVKTTIHIALLELVL